MIAFREREKNDSPFATDTEQQKQTVFSLEKEKNRVLREVETWQEVDWEREDYKRC